MRGVDVQRAITVYDAAKSDDADMYRAQKQRSLNNIQAHSNPATERYMKEFLGA